MAIESPVGSPAKVSNKRIPIRLLPSAVDSVFSGFCDKYQMFITGCIFPATTKNIVYFPGSVVVADVPIPPTVIIQYTPIFYRNPERVFNRTYIRCGCKICQRWSQFKAFQASVDSGAISLPSSIHLEANQTSPPRYMPHLGSRFCSHFGVYHFFQKDGQPFIRRLIMGNNKRYSDIFAPYIQSWVCWNYNGDQGYPRNLRDAYYKFWNAHFSFSYTGRERNLDDPHGYPEYLLSYTREAEQIAAAQGDQDISLLDLLSPLQNLVTSLVPRDGIIYNLRGYPKKPPRALFVDREDDSHWLIDGVSIPSSKIKICSAYHKDT